MNQQYIQQSLHELNALVIGGKLIEAFDKYYHDEVSMQENAQPPVTGKQLNRERELQFLSDVTEFRSAEAHGICAFGNLSCVVWSYDYTHKDWGVRNYTQVSVQEWKDGKIISEKFIYNN